MSLPGPFPEKDVLYFCLMEKGKGKRPQRNSGNITPSIPESTRAEGIFKLTSDYIPTGDQPDAIKQLSAGIRNGTPAQTLLGVTGSGKTFTIANVIREVEKPTLILSHNKTLAAQLYGEFRQFFPHNAVEYFVSYYDYYQPEAYLPVTDTYIEKDLSINSEIEKLRLSTTTSLLSGRRDIIVVSSVSCIYGIGNPNEFHENINAIKVGQKISRNKFLLRLVEALYSRAEISHPADNRAGRVGFRNENPDAGKPPSVFNRGNFRVNGDTVDVFLPYADFAYRICFFGDEIESISSFEPQSGARISSFEGVTIYPASIFVTSKETLHNSIYSIQDDLVKQLDYLRETGKFQEAKRLEDRVTYDLEMMRELGYCSGIENYSRYFDHRKAGERPFCLMDYFPEDFLMVIDESHATIPQIHGMFGGDRSRKQTLVEYGFRLPSALDNRPLKFDEFESMLGQAIYVSATPADYELRQSEGIVVEQVVRPTGLLDPVVEVRPLLNEVDDLLEEIAARIAKKERVLVTTLTKRMAEELSKYMARLNIRSRYIHSEVDTLERVEILNDLRLGKFDVLVGINLLREGLDLPEVSLVAILDADKEGFLRSARALTQTAGRAARNLNGKVILYAAKITDSMKKMMEETNRRREKQLAYNTKHNITPTQINKPQTLQKFQTGKKPAEQYYAGREELSLAADPVISYMSKEELLKNIETVRKGMEKAAGELNFYEAARLRDELQELQRILKKKS